MSWKKKTGSRSQKPVDMTNTFSYQIGYYLTHYPLSLVRFHNEKKVHFYLEGMENPCFDRVIRIKGMTVISDKATFMLLQHHKQLCEICLAHAQTSLSDIWKRGRKR